MNSVLLGGKNQKYQSAEAKKEERIKKVKQKQFSKR